MGYLRSHQHAIKIKEANAKTSHETQTWLNWPQEVIT